MDKLCLTIALERYNRHLPFFIGTVTPPADIEEVAVGTTPGRRDGVDRHGRMFRDRAFDICEQSLASYIMAKSRGLPLTATPVFPRRLFSQNHMFINVDAGIERPIDLIGKRVGVRSFQNTLCVFYPITHVLMFPQEPVTQEPRLPKAMIDVWKKAKRKADT